MGLRFKDLRFKDFKFQDFKISDFKISDFKIQRLSCYRAFVLTGFRRGIFSFSCYRDFDGGRFFFGGDLHFGQLALGFGIFEALLDEVQETFATLDDGFMVCQVWIGLWSGHVVIGADDAARLEGGGRLFIGHVGFFRADVLTC